MSPRSVTVLVDKREKRPLLFPATIQWFPDRSSHEHLIHVKEKVVRLDAGDYALEGHDAAGIERKATVDEIHKNLFTKDRKRAMSAFERFAKAFEVPYLLIEGSPAELWRPTRNVDQPAKVFDEMVRVATDLGFRLWFAGGCKSPDQRRRLGEVVLHVLVNHAFGRPPGDPTAGLGDLTSGHAAATIGMWKDAEEKT